MGNSNNKSEKEFKIERRLMQLPESAENVDSVVQSVLKQFIDRANFGKKKYGTTLDREDLAFMDWIQHTQEELMDAILYLEKLKKTIT